MGSNPIFPTTIKNIYSHSYISNHVNLLLSQKNLHKKIIYNHKNLKIVKFLYRAGVIANYLLFSKKVKNFTKLYIKISPFFYKNAPFFKKVTLVSTPSKKFYISNSTLLLINKTLKYSLIVLSTDKGLLTNKEALNLRLGGNIIYIIT